MALLKRWNAYWFSPAPLIDLAICRVMVVAFQLIYLLAMDHHNVFLKLAALPDALYQPLPALRLLVWPLGSDYRPSLEILEAIYRIALAAGALALVGLGTKLSLFVFALGSIFIHGFRYSFGDFHHPDALMMITLLALALSPAGGVLSLDDLWRRVRSSSRRMRHEVCNIADERSAFARWPLLLVQWMLALIYLSSAVCKLAVSGLDWMNGYTLQYYLFLDGTRYGSDLGIWLSRHHMLAWLLSWLAILFEGTFFLVPLFPRLAWLYLPLGAAIHTGIYMTMRAPFFQFIAIYAVFVPWSDLIKGLSRRLGSEMAEGRLEVIFDGHCPLCIRSMTILSYFDWLDRLSYTDLETRAPGLVKGHPEISLGDCRREIHLALPDGSVRKGFFAFREIIRNLPPLWPLLLAFYFPSASIIGPRVYSAIARRRIRIQSCVSEACARHYERG